MTTESALGINGLGRIGKLAVWYEVAGKRFSRLVVNTGREVGRSLDAIVHYLSTDSTYGSLGRFLWGHAGPRHCIEVVDRDRQLLGIDGVEVQLLTENRNPQDIGWAEHGVRLVVDTTGKFRDPTKPPGHPGGSLQGHLEAGAQAVLVSAAFKIADRSARLPDDSLMLIYGINHDAFDSSRHCLVSAASCTTTALAHMMLPLLNHELTHTMLTASMSTIHAATNSQSVLDSVPKAGAKDLRKNRSVMNNIILTSTNAAQALEGVMPEISTIGFLADSVRIPIPTASLIILNCTFQSKLDDYGNSLINRESINRIYADYAENPDSGVVFSEDQNVSTDMIGELAAVVIEGWETHTRTGFTRVDLGDLGIAADLQTVEVPVTHVKLFGWYDNELGSYTKRMSELCHHVAERIGVIRTAGASR
jgi:glyceraldehyde 3-phosphate dehydrogenase